jgi:hypothetical protein
VRLRQRDSDITRPPLLGRVLGWALGVLLIALTVHVAAQAVALLVLLLPVLLLLGAYHVVMKRITSLK